MTDMRGYAGHHAWLSFYAVLYMTENFYNQADVDHEFRLVKADRNWTPLVVVGPGTRKAKGVVCPPRDGRSTSRIRCDPLPGPCKWR
jgi:hypothetical protein